MKMRIKRYALAAVVLLVITAGCGNSEEPQAQHVKRSDQLPINYHQVLDRKLQREANQEDPNTENSAEFSMVSTELITPRQWAEKMVQCFNENGVAAEVTGRAEFAAKTHKVSHEKVKQVREKCYNEEVGRPFIPLDDDYLHKMYAARLEQIDCFKKNGLGIVKIISFEKFKENYLLGTGWSVVNELTATEQSRAIKICPPSENIW